ncbi:MAG: SDR family oxidoreductase [Pseudomonadales bacterium]|jgi:citronellol/citronellal dehydrogenase|nr:SDR family oxidoreductase [Pseudomonadales bacterium]
MPYDSGFRPNLFIGQKIFIPGGGGGLGRCIAHELAHLGADIVLAGRSLEKLERTRDEILADGGNVLSCHSAELRDESAVEQLVERIVASHGQIDGLVNAAGGQFPATLEDLSLNGWNAVLHNNLTSYFLVAREVYKQSMKAHGGAIVNLGADWQSGMPGMGHNGAARAGLSNFTQTAATEWAAHGVRVNCVIPGFIATTGLDRYPESAWPALRSVDKTIPLRRHGTAAEVSAMTVFLLSKMASYITGADFRVDGGKHNGAESFLFKRSAHGSDESVRPSEAYNGFHKDEPPQLLS